MAGYRNSAHDVAPWLHAISHNGEYELNRPKSQQCPFTIARQRGANLIISRAPKGAVRMMASTVTISTIWAFSISSVALRLRARSSAAGPSAAWTVAFGKPDSVTYAFSLQFSSLPSVESTATSSVIAPYSTVSPARTEKFTSLPINEKETGFRNFHSRSRYMLTSLHSVGGRLRHPVPATNAVTMHPSAPADG
uniref:Uncharacterized protein n=1 Tax=Anopheles atroparvus TaxID=41427 RepID=A0A182JLB5_ANOAO